MGGSDATASISADALALDVDLIESFIAHHGIKGMHWGIRKERDTPSMAKRATKQKTEDLSVKLKDGSTMVLSGERTPAMARFVSKLSPAFQKRINNSDSFQLKDPHGKTVGEMSLFKESPTSLNVVWVGVNNDARGHGYATAAMKAAISHAKKQGLATVTLEVPGKAPDALHIYKKLGFKVTHQVTTPHEDPVWGGLTGMRLDLKKGGTGMTHSDVLMSEISSDVAFVNDILGHSGVKGMHWGVRKAEVTTGSGSGGTGAGATRRASDSEDVKVVNKAKDKLAVNGTRVLSNEELQKVVTRMNLEQQYSKLSSTSPHDADVERLFKNMDRASKAYNYTQSPGGKAVIKGVQEGYKLAKRVASNRTVRTAASTALVLL